MADKKSHNPFENMGHSPDSEHTNLSDRVVATSSDASNIDPPPYTTTAPVASTIQESSSNPTQPESGNKPIAIPAIALSFDSPFIRAYAPTLAAHKLPKESFLSFLDQLNKIISGSPPLQVLDATGGILQQVPILFPIRWLGATVSRIANLGSQGVSKSRTDSYIRQANQDIFGPRGLKVEITKLDALAYIASLPILDSRGKVNRQSALFQRLVTETGGMSQEVQDVDVRQRQIKILQPWIAELQFEVLPWTSKSKLTRFNAALKKRNAPLESSAMRSQDAESNDGDKETRQCLWLVIRPVNA